MRRNALILAVAIVVAVVSPGPAVAAPCWLPPVVGRVADPFREPPCPYCAGNRGIDYVVGSNAVVWAVAGGRVTWSGAVAGTRYVVVQHTNGWRATYGQLTSTSLSTGDSVVSRARIGRASGSFYFGLRSGQTYIDPAPYLGRVVGRPRLVPTDGTAPLPAPRPRLRCG